MGDVQLVDFGPKYYRVDLGNDCIVTALVYNVRHLDWALQGTVANFRPYEPGEKMVNRQYNVHGPEGDKALELLRILALENFLRATNKE